MYNIHQTNTIYMVYSSGTFLHYNMFNVSHKSFRLNVVILLVFAVLGFKCICCFMTFVTIINILLLLSSNKK